MTKRETGGRDQAEFGISGLDDILAGGLERDRLYLLEGAPGTGKTTAAMSFLMQGAAADEACLYITLSETEEELRGTARSHGWSLEGIDIFELVPPESLLDEQQQQSLLYSSDLELGETTRMIFDAVEKTRPERVVIDSLSEIRLLAQGSLRYRRQVLALKHYFARLGVTVLLLDDLTTDVNDKTVHSVAHGVIQLQELAPEYGAERRRVRVIKYRGRRFRGGYHDFTIKTGGLEVYPRIVASEHRTAFDRSPVSSGVVGLDALLGGGMERGSSALILGPAGTGKSLFTINFAVAAVARGEKAALFVFDEELGLLYARMKGLGVDLEAMRDAGSLIVEQVDAAELSPGEFAARVRKCVSEQDIKTVVIDSLNGYQAAMPQEQFLVLHIHELLQYLNRQGASTYLTVAQHGLVGEMKAPVDVTYLADTVILLRYFEAAGQVRRAVSVIKKRAGRHEKTIREYEIGPDGLTLGEPLHGFQGVLRGVPNFVGQGSGLMGDASA
ncbi:MAG: ATPase domain-containing protein [Brevundimonas sp.]|uniref:ATPase domain-containing protein n=1 Tax=Brevundimonas sp. TaxID=1871086 RepID=UPI002608A2F2|nr:ATPase domain-containing protein [Brevundimonas sp.]MDI6623511.1 ATPase domain-containing protein [Brevundimonas sp.]MDQ7811429.1 ATPase domain-containing protein [Brevundimonas sp.]